MGKYHVFLSDRASFDIDFIHQYIEIVLSNPKAANNLVSMLENRIQLLITFPECYPIIDKGLYKGEEIRRMHVKNYYVFYRIIKEKQSVVITRVVYAKRDGSKITFFLK